MESSECVCVCRFSYIQSSFSELDKQNVHILSICYTIHSFIQHTQIDIRVDILCCQCTYKYNLLKLCLHVSYIFLPYMYICCVCLVCGICISVTPDYIYTKYTGTNLGCCSADIINSTNCHHCLHLGE